MFNLFKRIKKMEADILKLKNTVIDNSNDILDLQNIEIGKDIYGIVSELSQKYNIKLEIHCDYLTSSNNKEIMKFCSDNGKYILKQLTNGEAEEKIKVFLYDQQQEEKKQIKKEMNKNGQV